MEELKQLVELIKGLPALAIWVLVGFFIYKTLIIGSIYGLIRFGIDRLHSWLVTPKTELVRVESRIKDITLEADMESLLSQLRRLRAGYWHHKFGELKEHGRFIGDDEVTWLKKAIDNQVAADRKMWEEKRK